MFEYKFCVGEGQGFAHAASIRTAVFVIEQGFSDEFDAIDAHAIHLIVYDTGVPIATARAFVAPNDPQTTYTIGRVAVVKEKRGIGMGKLAMIEIEKHLCTIGAKELVLSAQCQAEGFYKSLGFMPYGEVYLDEHCPHQSMKKYL